MEKSIYDITSFDYPSNSKGCTCKRLRGNNIIRRLLQGFYSIHRGKNEQIRLAFSLPKETVVAIMMLYKIRKSKSAHQMKTDYFNIVAGVLQWDTLAPYLLLICRDYVLRMSIDLMKENRFKLEKERSRRYPAHTITDVDYADIIALLVNTIAQVETLLYNLERAAGGIGLHFNADKTEYMCLNQMGDISTLKDWLLKLVDKFTYLGSRVSSTGKDIMWLAKSCTAIDISVIWKSDLTDKIKHSFLQVAAVLMLLYRSTTWTQIKQIN